MTLKKIMFIYNTVNRTDNFYFKYTFYFYYIISSAILINFPFLFFKYISYLLNV